MTVRKLFQDFHAHGPLPSEDEALDEEVDRRAEEIESLNELKPVSRAEAILLLECFGPDTCFGVAWGILHLIETCPEGLVLDERPELSANYWHRFLYYRSRSGVEDFEDEYLDMD